MQEETADRITGTQLRAARALLGWSQQELADRAETSVPTVKRAEAQGNDPGGSARTNAKLRAAVEAGGVVFIGSDADGGRGVRLGVRDRTRRSARRKR